MKVRECLPEDATKIGARTRLIVLESLAELDYQPPDADFAHRIEQFATTLAQWGARMNLTARPLDAAETAFHVVDSIMPLVLVLRADGSPLKHAFADGRRVLDLGTGAGFPGLMLAAASSADFTLIEARRKRASFLAVAAATMNLHSVTIENAYQAPPSLDAVFDTVTARAFAAPAEVYRSAAAALKPDGVVILYANPGQELELNRADGCGLDEVERLRYNVPRGAESIARVLAISRKRR